MEKKFLLVSLDDAKAKDLADVLGNKTCKKVIDFLADSEKGEASEKDIADALGLPLNTVEYNLNKLIKTEIIEKSKTFFWSQKGKKIPTYKLSNKSIVISPKSSSRINSKLKAILPAAILSGLGAVAVKLFVDSSVAFKSAGDKVLFAAETTPDLAKQAVEGAADSAANSVITNPLTPSSLFALPSSPVIWFFAGAMFAIIIFTILNWRKL